MNGRRLWPLFGLLAACSSDSGQPTQVMVVIDAESQVRQRTREVHIEVRSGEGSVDDWEVRLRQSVTPGDRIEWPLEVALVPRGGDADRVYLAIASARDADGDTLAEVRAISGYQRGKTVSLLLLFEDSCLDKSESCNPEQTCRAGGCVDAHVDIFKLPAYERDEDGKPIATPFWNTDAGQDAGPFADAATDGAAGDAGDSGPGRDAEPPPPPADCAHDDACDDGDPCNGMERCDDGECAGGEPFTCPELEDQPCRDNVCVNDDGEARCDAQATREGESCREGDATDDPSATCARDYECREGECAAQTVDTCEATEACQELGGCDPESGCVYGPKASGESCDDGNPCTEDDRCDGSSFACTATPLDCDDGVACTADVCQNGACEHAPDHARCSKVCQTGVCDATADCQYSDVENFTECDDQRAPTTPDFCYEGACVGGARNTPTATCALAGCGCSGFAGVKDLEADGHGGYAGLIDANRTGAGECASTTMTVVYDVTLDALTAYTSDTTGGSIAKRGWAIDDGWAVADTAVGQLNPQNRTVDWVSNTFSGPLASGVPALTNFRGMARHLEGSFPGGSAHVWIWGSDSTTPTTARLARCSWTTCTSVPCAPPPITCSYSSAATAAQYVGAIPYMENGLNQTLYRGAIAALNLNGGPPVKRVYSDGISLGYTPTNTERDDADGSWYGTVALDHYSTSYVLVYGTGSASLLLCTDIDFNGDATCNPIANLPNQGLRSYYDATQTPNGDVLLLASSCTGICASASYYLVALPHDRNPADGRNWKEFPLSSSSLGSGRFATEVAAAGNTIMVLGADAATSQPHVFHFVP